MDKAKFFAKVRPMFGNKLSQAQVDGLNALLDTTEGWPISWRAYALATAFHETAQTMEPIEEYGGPAYFMRRYDITGERPGLAAKNGNVNKGDGAKYFGRGYVQLTWYANYSRFEKLLGVALTEQPQLALDPVIAAKILKIGMERGLFTGVSLKGTLPNPIARFVEFVQARRIINSLDKAEDIANLAVNFQKAFQ